MEMETVDAAMVERRDRVIRGWPAVMEVGSVDGLQRRSKTEGRLQNDDERGLAITERKKEVQQARQSDGTTRPGL